MGWGERPIWRGKGGEEQADVSGAVGYLSPGICLGLGRNRGPGLVPGPWNSRGSLC